MAIGRKNSSGGCQVRPLSRFGFLEDHNWITPLDITSAERKELRVKEREAIEIGVKIRLISLCASDTNRTEIKTGDMPAISVLGSLKRRAFWGIVREHENLACNKMVLTWAKFDQNLSKCPSPKPLRKFLEGNWKTCGILRHERSDTFVPKLLRI